MARASAAYADVEVAMVAALGSLREMPTPSPLACVENAVVAIVLAFDHFGETCRCAGRTPMDVYEEARADWEDTAASVGLKPTPHQIWSPFAEIQQQVETWRRLPWFEDALRRSMAFDAALKRAMQKGGGDS